MFCQPGRYTAIRFLFKRGKTVQQMLEHCGRMPMALVTAVSKGATTQAGI